MTSISTELTPADRQAGRGGIRSPARPTVGFLTPLLVIMATTTLVPIGYALYLSFFNWNWGNRFSFVGLENYSQLLADPTFWAAMARTGGFTAAAVVVETVLGLLLAVVVDSMTRGATLVRSVLIVPLMVSGIIVSVIWKVMLDTTLGVVPWALTSLHLPAPDLLGSPHAALWTIAGIDVWWQTAFVFIVLNAGLAGLSREPFEAAAVDGANAWQRFRFLTLPMLGPLVATVALIRMVDCLKVFAIVFGTTNGGPGRSTETAQVLAYRSAFKEFAMSRSMAMMLLYTLLIIVGVLVVAAVRRWRGAR